MYGAGTICGINKTTIYLPPDLKAALAREARTRGIPEAEVIRQALAASLRRVTPRGGLFASDQAFADRVDELLPGFGDR
jgi:hypothetical protein